MDSLHSPFWYRIASLHPRLARHVSVHRRVVRGQHQYVLRDALSGRNHRVNASAYRLVGRMNGNASLEQIWQASLEADGDAAPTQQETADTFAELVERGLVHCETTPQTAELFNRHGKPRKRNPYSGLNPLSLRIPLGNPSVRLAQWAPKLAWLLTAQAAWFWLALVGLTVVLAVQHADALIAEVQVLSSTPRTLLLLWLLYPIVKAIHELAHAVAITVWGGSVREVGVTLMLGIPVPYVNASDSYAFPEKHRRIAVAAIGIMAELTLAALAFMLWRAAQPGWVRDCALLIMSIGGVSTVLFNGNPLMRLDGYHVLVEAVGMPNLASRSSRCWRVLVKRWMLGVRARMRTETREEMAWLSAYGLASGAYRIFISVAVVLWLTGFSKPLAICVGLYLFYGVALKPIWAGCKYLWTSPQLAERRPKTLARVAVAVLSACAFIVWVPLPASTVAEGVVWIPPEAEIRTEESGFIERVLVADGEEVQAGTPLLQLYEPSLIAQLRGLEERYKSLEVVRNEAQLMDPGRSQAAQQAMQAVQGALTRTKNRIEALTVRASVDGTVSMPRAANLPDRFVDKGTVVAHVFSDELIRVRTVVPQEEIAAIPHRVQSIGVRVADRPEVKWTARLTRETPSATHKLPTAALGETSGGSTPLDPTDAQGMTTSAPVHVVDLKLDNASLNMLGGRVGTRSLVRFKLKPETLAVKAQRQIKQLFLSYFAAESAR